MTAMVHPSPKLAAFDSFASLQRAITLALATRGAVKSSLFAPTSVVLEFRSADAAEAFVRALAAVTHIPSTPAKD